MITLKALKHSEFASQETHCYTARVYFDGKFACEVANDGRGGCDVHHDIKPAVYAAMLQYVAQLPPYTYLDMATGDTNKLPVDLDMVCGELVNKMLASKHMRRLMKDRVVVWGHDGRVRYTQRLPADRLPAVILQYQSKGETVLNALPFEEALTYFRANP